MKNLFAIAFIGALILTSCAKKETETESNVMLAEPEVTVVDSAKTMETPAAMAPVATPAVVDSAK